MKLNISVASINRSKIRGFRIELGEIELVLAGHPAVREAVVVVRSLSGNDCLIAYVVPAHDAGPAVSDLLRKHLRLKLPAYMLPQSIEILTTLPLNRNGKVDRHALPAPAMSAALATARQPRTSTEEHVARLWADVLGTSGIGPDDNFFERGGQSLLAVRVASRLREAFGIELPVSLLFELQKLADLAAYIDSMRALANDAPPNAENRIQALTRVSRESVRRAAGLAEQSRGDGQ